MHTTFRFHDYNYVLLHEHAIFSLPGTRSSHNTFCIPNPELLSLQSMYGPCCASLLQRGQLQRGQTLKPSTNLAIIILLRGYIAILNYSDAQIKILWRAIII